MRLLVAVGLLASLALASIPISNENFGFANGRQYTYRYESKMTSRTPLSSDSRSYANLAADIIVTPTKDNEWLYVEAKNILVNNIENGKIVRETVDQDSYSAELKEFLTLPFRVNYKNGLVNEIEFLTKDDMWSMNIKKSIVDMLQVNLNKKRVDLFKNDDEVLSEVSDYKEFVAHERMFYGQCDVKYVLNFENKTELEYIKYVNFDNCSYVPELYSGFTDLLKKDSTDYVHHKLTLGMDSDKRQWIPVKNMFTGRQMFQSFVESAEPLFTAETMNKLVLIKEEPIRKDYKLVGQVRKEDVIYNMASEIAEEKFMMTGEEKYQREIVSFENRVDVVFSVLKKLVEHIDKPEFANCFVRFVQVLRWSSETEIRQIEKVWFKSELFTKLSEREQEKVRDYFTDALAIAGSRSTIRHLLQKFYKNQITAAKTVQVLKTLTQVPRSSEHISEDIYNFCESSQAQRNNVVRQSCWLTYGALLNGFCGQKVERINWYNNPKNSMPICNRELKMKLIEKLFNKLNSASDRYEKVLLLKTIANAGIDISVHALEKYIMNRQHQSEARVESIYALRRLRMPLKIQKILLSVVLDQTEVQEVRMAAWAQILRTEPSESLILQVIKRLTTERSRQMHTYVRSSLKAIAESKLVHERKFAQRVRQLEILYPETEKIMLSQQNKWTMYDNLWEAGLGLKLDSIFTNSSLLPEEVRASLEGVFGSEWQNSLLDFGITQHNVDLLLQKFFEMHEKISMENLIVRGKREIRINPVEYIRSLIQKVGITRRTVNKNDSRAVIYFRFRDLDFAFVPLDLENVPETIKNLIQDGKIMIGSIEEMFAQNLPFNFNSVFYVYELAVKKPAYNGLPCLFTARLPVVFSAKGQAKLELTPVDSKKWTGFNLHLQAEPIVTLAHQVEVSFNTRLVQHGLRVNQHLFVNFPINLRTIGSWENGEVILRNIWKTFESSQKLVQIRSHPYTFMGVWKSGIKHYPEPEEITLKNNLGLWNKINYVRNYFKNTGLDVEVKGEFNLPVERNTYNYHPIYTFFANHKFDLDFVKTVMPREYTVQMRTKLFEVVENMLNPHFEDFYKGEDKNEEELEHFNKYYKELNIEKAYKHFIKMHLESSESPEAKMAEFLVETTCDEHMRYCRWSVEADRIPLKTETSDWKLRAVAQTLYPKFSWSLEELKKQLHRDVVSFLQVNWGSDEKYFVNLKLHGEHSKEQREWFSDLMKNSDFEKNNLKKAENSWKLYEILSEAGRLDQYNLVASYHLDRALEERIDNIMTILRIYNWMDVDYKTIDTELKEHRLAVYLTIEPVDRQYCNLTIRKDDEEVTFNKMRMPYRLPVLNIQTHYGPVHNVKHVINKMENVVRAECKVSESKVKTFDRVVYRAPLTTCYSIVAKDCSETEKPKFLVLAKKTEDKSEELTIQVVSGKNIYELEKRSTGKMYVKVNNEIISNVKTMEKYHIYLKSEKTYEIELPYLTVIFNGYETKIKMSPLFKNKQCGMCGHYDNDESNDLRRADNEDTENIEEFHRSYLIEECKNQDMVLSKKENYEYMGMEEIVEEMPKDKFELGSTQKFYTHVIEENSRMCFSDKPILKCSNGASKTTEVNTVFKCVSKSDTKADMFRKMSRKGYLPKSMLDRLDEYLVQKLRVPVGCL